MTENTTQTGGPATPVVDQAAAAELAASNPAQTPADQAAAAAVANAAAVNDGLAKPSIPADITPAPVITTEGEDVDNNPPLDAEVGEDGAVEYVPTGDAGMDMALSFVGKLGLRPDHPAMLKAGEGDFSFIKAHLSGLGDKAQGWEQYVALAERSFADAVGKADANAKAIQAVVHTAAGGADAWAEISAWASANATPAEKASINSMLADTLQARAAVMLLQEAYQSATGTTINPASAIPGGVPDAGGGNAAANAPLSPKAYAAEVQKLARSKGADAVNQGSPEYRALQQRAAAYQG